MNKFLYWAPRLYIPSVLIILFGGQILPFTKILDQISPITFGGAIFGIPIAAYATPEGGKDFVMIKPDGVRKGLIGEIIKRMEQRDLKVVALEMFQPTFKEMDNHYPKDEKWINRLGERTRPPTLSMATTSSATLALPTSKASARRCANGSSTTWSRPPWLRWWCRACTRSTWCARLSAPRCRTWPRWALSAATTRPTRPSRPTSRSARSTTSSTLQKLPRKRSTRYQALVRQKGAIYKYKRFGVDE
jgi:hypothetical protein